MLIQTSKSQPVLYRAETPRPAAVSTAVPEIQDTVAMGSASHRAGALIGSVVSAGTTAAAVLKAFPDFVYPSIHNTTSAEQAQIMKVLDGLPLHNVSAIDNISMVTEIESNKPGWVILGRANDYGTTNQIQLSRTELTTAEKFESTLTHEIGHTTDYSHKPHPLGNGASSHAPFGEGPHVSEYAKTNPKEDYAESYDEFHHDPENLKKTNPAKYDEMVKENRPSFFEKLVDRKEFRETGKAIGDMMGPNRPTRHALQVTSYAASFVQVGNGLQQWVGSAETGDSMAHVSGILGTVSGAIMASGMAPLAGVGVQAASLALKRSVSRNEVTPAEVESTIVLPLRPLESAFGRAPSRIEKDHRPAKVLAVAGGGALGGTVGALAGPYLGVMAGYHIAGGVGGAIGLAVGGFVGFMGGVELGSRAGAALAEIGHS